MFFILLTKYKNNFDYFKGGVSSSPFINQGGIVLNKKMRICSVCRCNYQFCPHCNEDRDKELWHFAFCSSNCKMIYDITSKYENGQILASESKMELDKLDLSKLDKFGESYKTSIEKINSAAIVNEVVEKKTNEENIKTTDEEIINITKEISETLPKNVYKKSNRVKKNVE